MANGGQMGSWIHQIRVASGVQAEKGKLPASKLFDPSSTIVKGGQIVKSEYEYAKALSCQVPAFSGGAHDWKAE